VGQMNIHSISVLSDRDSLYGGDYYYKQKRIVPLWGHISWKLGCLCFFDFTIQSSLPFFGPFSFSFFFFKKKKKKFGYSSHSFYTS
jgi:hypothetical protein